MQPAFHKVRGPETGLVMVRGRAGGGGNPFNLGEATVTRATVRLETGEVGHAYCLGRDGDKAVIAACFDALLQRDPDGIEAKVLAPLRAEQAAADQQLSRRNGGHQGRFLHHGAGRRLMDLAIEGGFADRVLGAQSVFRALMDALSRPGRSAGAGQPRDAARAAHARISAPWR